MSRIILLLWASAGWIWAGSDCFAAAKPVAIVYIAQPGHQDAALKRMILQAHNDFGLILKEYPLTDEVLLADTVEKIADEEVGLVVILHPHNIEALTKIPGLYPDIHFSVIGVPAPVYVSNVQSLLFRDEEGMFMIGALAAAHAGDKPVGFVSNEDDKAARNLAYGFFQGATYVKPSIDVLRQLGSHTHEGKSMSGMQAIVQQFGKGADTVFIADDELLLPASRLAGQQHRFIITMDDRSSEPSGQELSGIVLTGLRIRYDLAMYDTLKAYAQDAWKPDSKYVGIGGGYIDYVLNDANKALLSPALIEKVETAKDLVAQGAVKVAHYTAP